MHVLLRGSWMQRSRLAAGLVLLAFTATHFINHALGIVSLDAMARMQVWRIGITRSSAGTLVLGLALFVHVALGLARLAERRTWRMPLPEAFQIASGLAIPLLLFPHIVDTRIADRLFGTDDSYHLVVPVLWSERAFWQTALLVLVWGHACVGLHLWLRLVSWYGLIRPMLVVAAVALPVLALAGFAVAGRDTTMMLTSPAAFEELRKQAGWPDAAGMARLRHIAWIAIACVLGPAAALAAMATARRFGFALQQQVAITFSGGPSVRGPVGATLLEISRMQHVPHASVCGGRARCSTCRVRIDAGGDSLRPPGMAEAVTLGAIGAPPGVRLACQIRPTAPLTVTRLVAPPGAGRIVTGSQEAVESGVERKLAVMFLDVRGFTRLSEKRLPYDVVFLLNQFFTAVGAAIQAEGGWIDKYLGDGLLAVFGRETDARTGCRQALAAARAIDLALDVLNVRLVDEIGERLAVGIGIHAGTMVVGRIGHPDTAALTVIGRTVNTASRLESLTKDKGVQLVVSTDAADTADWPARGLPRVEVEVRGLSEPMEVILVTAARQLPERLT